MLRRIGFALCAAVATLAILGTRQELDTGKALIIIISVGGFAGLGAWIYETPGKYDDK